MRFLHVAVEESEVDDVENTVESSTIVNCLHDDSSDRWGRSSESGRATSFRREDSMRCFASVAIPTRAHRLSPGE